MGSESDRFVLPRRQTEKRADAKPTKSGIVTPHCALETPIEIALRTGGVHLGVNFTIVGFLIDDQTFRSSRNDREVIRSFHRTHFDRDGGEIGCKNANALCKIILGNELRMLAGHEQKLPEALRREVTRFSRNLLDAKRDAQNWIVARETAIPAIIDALVRQIKGREKPHCSPEVLARERLGLLRHPL